MAKVETFKCDQCGKHKGEVNHWYVALLVMPDTLQVRQWDEVTAAEGARQKVARHLCGQQCVIAETAAWMNNLSAQRSEPTER